MARAGFVYSGTRENADSAQCVICLKELDSWDPEDDPWLVTPIVYSNVLRKPCLFFLQS